MYTKDRVALLCGFLIAVFGALCTIFWSAVVGLLSLILLNLLVVVFVFFQRRQLLKMQQRLLGLVQSDRQIMLRLQEQNLYEGSSTKKILGLLQAQQVGLDMLNAKIECTSEDDNTSEQNVL